MKIDFNAPAFGPGSQTIEAEALETPEAKTPPVEIKKIEVDEEPATPPADGGVPEQKVPYSRFSKVYDRATKAEQEAEEARQKYLDLLEQRQGSAIQKTDVDTSDPLWGSLVKLYGDNDTTRQIYETELERAKIMEERAERRALESVRNDREMEARALSQNEDTIDGRLQGVASMLGRDLTESEELAVLEIVDEYTPKGEDGNYLGDTLPFDKAWEIYELKQGAASASGKKARSTATKVTSAQSEGEPSNTEKDKNWNAFDWSFMRKY